MSGEKKYLKCLLLNPYGRKIEVVEIAQIRTEIDVCSIAEAFGDPKSARHIGTDTLGIGGPTQLHAFFISFGGEVPPQPGSMVCNRLLIGRVVLAVCMRTVDGPVWCDFPLQFGAAAINYTLKVRWLNIEEVMDRFLQLSDVAVVALQYRNREQVTVLPVGKLTCMVCNGRDGCKLCKKCKCVVYCGNEKCKKAVELGHDGAACKSLRRDAVMFPA